MYLLKARVRVRYRGGARARPPRSRRLTPPARRHRRLDRADALRRLQRRPGVEALVRELLDPRLLVLRGEPADAEDLRHRRAGAARGGLPQRRRRHEADRDRARDRGGREGQPRLARLVVLLDRQPRLRLQGRPHDLRRDLSARRRRPSARRCTSTRCARSSRRTRPRACRPTSPAATRSTTPRPAAERRPERAHRGADRRPRLPRDPVLRLRHAAGGADADRGRDRLDPEHVHARLDPDLRHERLDHRPVPDRARRARRGDRLRAADDLPLPRRAARGRGRRDGARRDDDPRGPVGDRLGLDGGRRPALDARAAAAVHPLDRDRRDADPDRLGDHRDHAAAGAAGDARPRGSTASACCRSASSTAAIPRTAPGAAGRGSSCAIPGRLRRPASRSSPCSSSTGCS